MFKNLNNKITQRKMFLNLNAVNLHWSFGWGPNEFTFPTSNLSSFPTLFFAFVCYWKENRVKHRTKWTSLVLPAETQNWFKKDVSECGRVIRTEFLFSEFPSKAVCPGENPHLILFYSEHSKQMQMSMTDLDEKTREKKMCKLTKGTSRNSLMLSWLVFASD